MKRHHFSAILLTALVLPALPAQADDIDDAINAALIFAQEQAEELTDVLGNNRENFVDYSHASGSWDVTGDATWTSGFVPGLFWRLYDYTGEQKWRDHGEHWSIGLISRASAADNDIGFQVYYGLGLATVYTGNETYKGIALKGANFMAETRFNENVGAFRSWPNDPLDPYDPDRIFEVIIDQMMNLELALWAGTNGGDPELVVKAVRHADTSWEHHSRPDGSTYHVVIFDPQTGELERKRTHQGWKEESTWTRGQAWAVYGNIMVHRYTGEQRFIDRSIKAYDYFMSALKNSSDDWVPPSDFDAPLDAKNPKDSSAAAIVASAAVELYSVTGQQRFIEDARKILHDLSTTYLAKSNPDFESILLQGSEKWGANGKVGTIFGDYYFIEAMVRYKKLFPNGFDSDPEDWRDDGKFADFTLQEGDFADTGEWLGMLYAGLHPWLYSYSLDRWVFLPETYVDASGAWTFLMHN